MSSTLTPRHGSWAPWVIQVFLVCALPSFLSSATMSLAVIYFLPQVACNAQLPLTPVSRVSSLRLSPLTGAHLDRPNATLHAIVRLAPRGPSASREESALIVT